MKFEIKDYDVSYNKDNHDAIVYKDGHEVLMVGFHEDASIYSIVSGVAKFLVFAEFLSEDDIKDVMEICGIPMENAREELRRMRESKSRIHIAS